MPNDFNNGLCNKRSLFVEILAEMKTTTLTNGIFTMKSQIFY